MDGESDASPGPKGSRIWWWIVAAFAVQIAVWTAWFIIAAKNRVEEIPVVGPSRPARGK